MSTLWTILQGLFSLLIVFVVLSASGSDNFQKILTAFLVLMLVQISTQIASVSRTMLGSTLLLNRRISEIKGEDSMEKEEQRVAEEELRRSGKNFNITLVFSFIISIIAMLAIITG